MFGDDKSQASSKFMMGMLIILMAIVGLVGLVRVGAPDGVNLGAIPSGFWWGLLVVFGVFLLTGVVWVLTGIRALFLPTSLVYRMMDVLSLFERFTRTR